jgi:hypothetical protein
MIGPNSPVVPVCVVLPYLPVLLSVTNLPIVMELVGLFAFAELRAPSLLASLAQPLPSDWPFSRRASWRVEMGDARRRGGRGGLCGLCGFSQY